MKLFLTITNFIENYFLKIVNFFKNFLTNFTLFFKNFLAHLALISLILEQFIFVASATAQALPIVTDGSTNTQITQTASGIDQINIATPNANGISHNNFDNYNINAGGQIINNFSGKNPAEITAGDGATAVTQTQIGGLVIANSNLNVTGGATIIINEVTSGSVSQLLGYAEIAGTKADLILANPNGITCNGCGFINTARLLMVAGKSDFDKNGGFGFNLKEQIDPNLYVPLITIDGLGLDASRVAGAEIVASSVKLLASIYGNKDNSLLIKTGEGKYDYVTKNIDSTNDNNDNSNAQSSAPVFAIDASALAKIQAGQVYLIATKQGVGVKMEGEILASQTLNLEANGDIYYKNISAGDTVNLKSSATIKNIDVDSSILAPNIDIDAEHFDNSALVSAYNLNIKNGKNFNNSGNLEALNLNLINIDNINNSGSIFGQNSLNIAGKNLTNDSAGSIYSPQDYSIVLTNLLSNSGLISSENNLNIVANGLTNNSEISAQNNLNFLITNSAINSGSLIAKNALNFNADSLTNSGTIQSDSSLTFNLSSLINQKNALIYAKDSLNINIANNLKNFGKISALNDLIITGNSAIKNYSKILANGDLSISANSLKSGSYGTVSLLDGVRVDINSPDFGNNSDAIISSRAKSLNLSLANSLDNFGELSSVDALNISAPSFANFANIVGNNNLNFSASFDFFNGGNIKSNQNIKIITSYFYNSGLTDSLQNTIIDAGNISNQSDGKILTTSDLTLISNSVNNLGLIYSGSDFIAESSSFTNSGNIYSANIFNIANSSKLINSGTFYSDGNLAITSGEISNNNSALIYGNKDISLVTNFDFINSGNLQTIADLFLSIGNNTDNSGVIIGKQITLNNIGDITNSGSIGAENDINLFATNFINSGLVKNFGNSNFTLSGNFANNLGASIYVDKNLALNIDGSLNNFGDISTLGNALTINSDNLTNSNKISSNGDLNILVNSLTNIGTLSSLGSLDIKSNSTIINDNQILSNGNLRIVATSLNNSSTIQSHGNIAIILNNLSNSKNISANKDLNIVSNASVSNSGTMQSVESFNIETDNFTNLSKSLILAGGDLNIRASAVSNQNTKSVDSYVTSGIVSANGAVNIFADNLNNNAGIIVGKSTSVSALNNASVNLENNLGSFISTAEIILNLGNLDYTITGTITASNIDITANNIANQGNVTASDFINLNATGISGVAGSGNITNGFADGDNSNISLASGTYINLIAKNNINNYGAIIGTTDVTLTASDGNVNNYGTGAINGGSGTVIVNALNGSFNNNAQTSIFTANYDAIFNAKDLNNFGEISVANDLITNIENNLTNNPTALIWSGRDAIFNVANIFLNNQAKIYADRNLTIQKNTSLDPTQNKTNLVQNISGSIETYSGDIDIKAVTLENKRSSMKSQGADFVYGQAYVRGGDCHRNWRGKLKCNPRIYRNLHAGNIYGIAGLEASVLSGGGINITSNSLLNDASSIISSANFGINTSIFNNNSYSFVQYDDTNRRYEYYTSFIKSGGALTITQNGALNSSLINGSNVVQYVSSAGNSRSAQNTSINHIDIYKLAQTGVLAVDLSSIINAIKDSGGDKNISANVAPIEFIKATSNHRLLKIVSADLISQAMPTSSVEAVSAPNVGIVFSGNFKINLDPSATTPLIESRSQFTDVSKFFGSSYYFDQFGLNGSSVLADLDRQTRNNNTRIIGDSAVESELIIKQLKKLTSDSLLLSKTTTDPSQQIKELLDNSVNQFVTLGLNAQDVAMNGLTAEQANSLTKDIVTFELTNVGGVSVLAPKIYLSQDTRNRLFNPDSLTAGTALANSSTIFAKENLTIDSPNASLINNGSIASGGDLAMNIASLTNKTNSLAQAQIIANNNLSITAQEGDIKNIGANIGAISALNIEALKGNILNSAIVQTNDQNLLNQNADSYQLKLGDSAKSSGNITSTLLQNASIKGGSIAINAGDDFTNLGAEISTTKNTLANDNILPDGSNTTSGNIAITAGDDINIETLQLRNRQETSWGGRKKGGSLVVDQTKNIGSDIESAGSLSLMTTGLGTNNEKALVDQKFTEAQKTYNNDLATYDKAMADYPSKLANYNDALAIYNSEISAGAFKFRLDKEPTPPEIPVAPKAPIYSQIMASVDNGGSDIKIVGSDISSKENMNLVAKDDVNILSAIDIYHKEEKSHKKSFMVKKSYEAITDKTTNVSSNLTSGGDMNISSGNDTNILASNLTGAGSGDILVGAHTDLDTASATYGQTIYNDNASLNILNGVDTKRLYLESTKTKTGLSLENALMTAAMVGAVAFSGGAAAGMILASGAVGGAVGSVNKQKTTNTEIHYDETIVASKLNFGNNLTLSSMNDVNLRATKVEAGGDIAINAVNNLTIATASEAHQTSYDLKDKGNYFFKNGQSGNYNTDVINTEITSNGGTNSNLTFNVGNATVAQYNKASGDNTNGVTKTGLDGSILYGDFSENSKLAYLDKLDSSKTIYDSVEEINKSWDQTNRGLTKAGQAVVAITATALTMGAMDPVSGSLIQGALVAGASAAASTASISAANSAMNADGDVFKQLKTISKDSWDNTTSKESVKNIAIASLAGGLTVGLTNVISAGSFIAPATTTTASTLTTNASALERIGTNLKNSFQEVAINTVASSASQSAINGDSFIDSLKAQGKNVLIYTMAKVGANEIGRAYHGTTTLDANGNVIAETPPIIDKSQQLLLHAGLGAITSSLTGNDAMSGAIAGVAGELTAEIANENGAGVATSIQLANLAGAISSITYGGLTNQSDDEMAKNAWEGSRIGGNAGANNAVLVGGKYKIPGSDSIKTSDEKDYDLHFGVQGTLTRVSANFGTDGFGLGADLNPSIGIGLYGNILPHGESASYSVITGFKNSSYGSGGLIITNQGNYGVTASWGASISFYPIPTNITASIPLENLKQK